MSTSAAPNTTLPDHLRRHQDQMVTLLTRLVDMESPSSDKSALDRLGALLAEHLQTLDARVEILHQPRAGDHSRARWQPGPGGALLLCHMDTVWDVGTVFNIE